MATKSIFNIPVIEDKATAQRLVSAMECTTAQEPIRRQTVHSDATRREIREMFAKANNK